LSKSGLAHSTAKTVPAKNFFYKQRLTEKLGKLSCQQSYLYSFMIILVTFMAASTTASVALASA
jgi:hypothetical protein